MSVPDAASALHLVVRYALALVFAFYVVRQVRKPDRGIGRLFLWLMNISHSRLTDWGLNHIRIGDEFTILDVGCGGGRTIQKLAAAAPRGTIYGIDYASGSVAAARAKNRDLTKAGRVHVERASVSQLPFPPDKFDLVTAVETQYYWPDLVKDMQEVLRTLKPGGVLAIIAESYKGGGASSAVQRPVMKLLNSSNLGVQDQRELFARAGYEDVQVFEDRSKGWICVLGRKPVGGVNPVLEVNS